MHSKSLTAKEIRQKLVAKSIQISYIAEALQCSSSHVSNIISRKAQSKRVAECVSRALNLPIEDVFGDVSAYFNHAPSIKESRQEHKNRIVSALRDGQSIQL
jgi:hypothetical protein